MIACYAKMIGMLNTDPTSAALLCFFNGYVHRLRSDYQAESAIPIYNGCTG